MKEFHKSGFFRILVIGFIFLSLITNFIPISNSGNYDHPNSQTTSYKRIGQILYAQNLGGVQGLAVAGINAIEGDTNTTDMIMVGTTGSGSWRGLQGYYANESTSLAKIMNDNDDAVPGMVKYVDPQDQNSKIIYITQGTDAGTIVRQEAANPTYTTAPTVQDNGKSTFSGSPLISICAGNFDDDADFEVAALSTGGKMVGLMNLQTPNQGTTFYQFTDGSTDVDYRKFHTRVVPIPNIDASGIGYDDIIAGFYTFVAAISTNHSVNALIWQTDLQSRIGGVATIDDMNDDGILEVLATSRSGIYLLDGASGTLLWNMTGRGSTYRDLIVYNDINGDSYPEVMTGNWDGEVLIFDVNLTSPTFGTLIANNSLSGGQVTRFLKLEDLTGDGIPEYAVGGTGNTGVLYGNNASWYWKKSVIGSGYWLNPSYIKVYDMALLNDHNSDGKKDFAVTGAYELQDSGVFIFNSQGILTPDSTDDTTSDDSSSIDSSPDDGDSDDGSNNSTNISIPGSFEFFALAFVIGTLYLIQRKKR